MSNTGRDLFDDAKMHTLVKLKDDIDPTAVFIGRNHPVLGYGQTGMLLFDSGWEAIFLPDNDDDLNEEHTVDRKDVVRTQELLINPAPYS